MEVTVAAVSLNRTVTPLIAEIKKLMYAHAVELMSVNELLDILHPRFKDRWL